MILLHSESWIEQIENPLFVTVTIIQFVSWRFIFDLTAFIHRSGSFFRNHERKNEQRRQSLIDGSKIFEWSYLPENARRERDRVGHRNAREAPHISHKDHPGCQWSLYCPEVELSCLTKILASKWECCWRMWTPGVHQEAKISAGLVKSIFVMKGYGEYNYHKQNGRGSRYHVIQRIWRKELSIVTYYNACGKRERSRHEDHLAAERLVEMFCSEPRKSGQDWKRQNRVGINCGLCSWISGKFLTLSS